MRSGFETVLRRETFESLQVSAVSGRGGADGSADPQVACHSHRCDNRTHQPFPSLGGLFGKWLRAYRQRRIESCAARRVTVQQREFVRSYRPGNRSMGAKCGRGVLALASRKRHSRRGLPPCGDSGFHPVLVGGRRDVGRQWNGRCWDSFVFSNLPHVVRRPAKYRSNVWPWNRSLGFSGHPGLFVHQGHTTACARCRGDSYHSDLRDEPLLPHLRSMVPAGLQGVPEGRLRAEIRFVGPHGMSEMRGLGQRSRPVLPPMRFPEDAVGGKGPPARA